MNQIQFIFNHLKKNKWRLFSLIFATIGYAIVSLFSTLVVSYAVDNVISGKEVSGKFTLYIDQLIGGYQLAISQPYRLALLIIGINVIIFLLMMYRYIQQGQVSERLVEDIRNDLYISITQYPYSVQKNMNSGEMIQKCTSDVDTIRRFFNGQLAEIFYTLAVSCFALVVLYSINVKLALYATICLPIIFIYSFFFFKKVQQQFILSDNAEGVLSNTVSESLSGIRVIKAFNRELYEIQHFSQVNQEYSNVTMVMMKYLAGYWASSYGICLASILLIVIMGIEFVINGELSLGNYIVFISYQSSMLFPIRQLGRILTDMGKVSVSIKRLIGIVEEQKEDLISGDKPDLSGDIVMNHVSFAYPDDTGKDILDDINLTIHQGDSVAFIGPTGSGKSTLMYLLTRLYDCDSGVIYINGHDIKSINKEYLRNNVSIVLQEPYLFSKSIVDNLKIVNPLTDDENIYKACRIASVHDVIQSFDKGYQTLVGEKGVTLSGGQKQRLAIARTILKDSKVVIFDDSLSAVDSQTDMQIRHALNQLDKRVTKIIITQRINTACECDQIFVIENGKITQQGTHNQLVNQDGLYKRVNAIQTQIIKGGE